MTLIYTPRLLPLGQGVSMCTSRNPISILPAVCILGLLCACSSSAQSTPGSASEIKNSNGSNSPGENPIVVTRPAIQPINSGDYILGEGDSLSIRVFGADDLSDKPVVVGAEGDIIAPLLGRVNA